MLKIKTKKIPHFKQHDQMYCGATCLRIVAKFFGRNISIQKLRSMSQGTKTGVNLLGFLGSASNVSRFSGPVKHGWFGFIASF